MSPTVGTAALLITFSNYPDFYPTVHFKRQIQNTWLNKSASLQVPVQIGIFPFFPLKPKKILNFEENKTVNYFPWWLATILQCEFRYRLSTCWKGKKENSEIAAYVLKCLGFYIPIYEGVCLFVSVINKMHVPGEEKPGSVHFWVSVVQHTVGAQLTFCWVE